MATTIFTSVLKRKVALIPCSQILCRLCLTGNCEYGPWGAQSLSPVWLFATPWIVASKSPLSMEFSSQEYWSGLPFLSPRKLFNPGIKPKWPLKPKTKIWESEFTKNRNGRGKKSLGMILYWAFHWTTLNNKLCPSLWNDSSLEHCI